MPELCKHVYEKIKCRKYQEYSILTDKDIHDSFRDKKRLFFKPSGVPFKITKDEIKKYYGDKLHDFSLWRYTFVVERKGDKVSFKYYNFEKKRSVGVHYFRTTQSVYYVTYNLKTNIVYSGKCGNKKNYKKILRANDWRGETINEVFGVAYQSIKNIFNSSTNFDLSESEMFFQIVETFFNEIIGNEFKEIIKEQRLRFHPKSIFLKNFLDKNNIVYPNNYKHFFNFTNGVLLKDIRKNENNLLKTIENKYGITGKKFHRVLHQVMYFNHYSIELFKQILNENEFKSLTDDQLKKIIESDFGYENYVNSFENVSKVFNKIISKSERKNMLTCLKFSLDGGSLITFIDHIRFYVMLKVKYNIEVFWKSKTDTEFSREHVNFSDKISECKQGNYTRLYPELFYDNIVKPLYGPQGGVCFPVLLQEQKEFFDESFIQSNCVKTYIKTINSVIVSLREGSINSKERATIEYRLKYTNNKWSVSRVQSLGRFNKPLNVKWEFYLEEIDNVLNNSLKFFDIKQYKFQNKTMHTTKKYLVETNNFGNITYKDTDKTTTNEDDYNFFLQDYLDNY